MLLFNNNVYIKDIHSKLKSNDNTQLAATILKNLQAAGFTADSNLLNAFIKMDKFDTITLGSELITTLQDVVGIRDYKPMYPNFPDEVINMDDADLYLNAVNHYLTGALPDTVKLPREALIEDNSLTVLKLVDIEDVYSYVTSIITSKIELAPKERKFIEDNKSLLEMHIITGDEKIVNKETLGFLSQVFGIWEVLPKAATATDVLRLLVGESEGDVSLARNSRFKNFPRKLRKEILSTLNNLNQNQVLEEMWKYRQMWLRLGEKIHPGEPIYKEQFPKIFKTFDNLRNNKKPETFFSKVEHYLKTKDLDKLLAQLTKRPGIFARRLDEVLRVFTDNADKVLKAFESVSVEIDSKVLGQVKNHFDNRDKSRVVFSKKNSSLAYQLDPLPELDDKVSQQVSDICLKALIEIYRNYNSYKEDLGTCYINPDLKNFAVPSGQRSASDTLVPLARGTRIPFDAEKTFRFFTRWHNLRRNNPNKLKYSTSVDLDLSAVFVDESFMRTDRVWFGELINDFGYLSGDITDAPRGASEFLDVDIEKALRAGYRYIVPSVHSFSGQPFNVIDEAFVGWMERKNLKSGEIFEPTTVKQKIDLNIDSVMYFPCIIDLKEKYILWVDSTTSISFVAGASVGNKYPISTLQALTQLTKPNLYDVFYAHAKARGKLVDSPDEADTVFDVFDGDISAINDTDIVSTFI